MSDSPNMTSVGIVRPPNRAASASRSTVSDIRLTNARSRRRHLRIDLHTSRSLGMTKQPTPNGVEVRRRPSHGAERRRRLEDQSRHPVRDG